MRAVVSNVRSTGPSQPERERGRESESVRELGEADDPFQRRPAVEHRLPERRRIEGDV